MEDDDDETMLDCSSVLDDFDPVNNEGVCKSEKLPNSGVGSIFGRVAGGFLAVGSSMVLSEIVFVSNFDDDNEEVNDPTSFLLC